MDKQSKCNCLFGIMFDEKCCLLCLEPTEGSKEGIDIDSSESQSLDVQCILEKYFKTELKSALSSGTIHLVCRQCWETVSVFHEFCVRVQRAHAANVKLLRSSKITAEAVEVKSETTTDVPAIGKRRRGRPRKASVMSPQNSGRRTRSNQIEESPSNTIEHKTEIADITDFASTPNNIQLNAFSITDIKHEVLQEESMDMTYSADADGFEHFSGELPSTATTEADIFENCSESVSTQDQLYDSAAESTKKRTRKKEGRKKVKKTNVENDCKKSHRLSQDTDEYIAKHMQLNCCLCSSEMENFHSLKIHFRKEHQVDGYVLCCGKKLLNRGVLVDHLRVHDNPEHFKCTQCGKVMADRRCLDVHEKTHEDAGGRIYRCNICSKSFTRISTLKMHSALHIPPEQRQYACSHCDKKFSTNISLKQHIRLVHLNMYLKVCDICGKSLRGPEAFNRHLEEHAGVVRVPVKCEMCNAILMNKYRLARHIKVMHSEEFQVPQICGKCGKKSSTLRAHKYHVKYMHDMGRKHVCTICNKGFKRPNDLKEHMATHTGDVLYTCTFCPKTFNSNANMYAHRKKAHPKEWAESRLQKHSSLQQGNNADVTNK